MSFLNSLVNFVNPIPTIQLQNTAKKDCYFLSKNGPGQNANNKPEVVKTIYYLVNSHKLTPISKENYESHFKIWNTAYRSELAATNPKPVGQQNPDGSYSCESYWGEKHIAVNWKKLAALAAIAGIVITASTRIL